MDISQRNQTRHYAIIVAGGSGLRFGAELPKQFLKLCGMPILMYTIKAFYDAIEGCRIILVLPRSHQQYWQELRRQHHFDIAVEIATAGSTRYESVKNGLACIREHSSENVLVAIHDGVRPLVTRQMIEDAYFTAREYGSAIPVIPVVDSVRQRQADGSTKALQRNLLYAVQTPQAFRWETLKDAYDKPYNDMFTDDASVVEANGECIHTYKGDIRNLKITHPIDLVIAQYHLENE